MVNVGLVVERVFIVYAHIRSYFINWIVYFTRQVNTKTCAVTRTTVVHTKQCGKPRHHTPAWLCSHFLENAGLDSAGNRDAVFP